MYKKKNILVDNKKTVTRKREILYCGKFHFSKTPLKKSDKWKQRFMRVCNICVWLQKLVYSVARKSDNT